MLGPKSAFESIKVATKWHRLASKTADWSAYQPGNYVQYYLQAPAEGAHKICSIMAELTNRHNSQNTCPPTLLKLALSISATMNGMAFARHPIHLLSHHQ
jgi:hypothetical protein